MYTVLYDNLHSITIFTVYYSPRTIHHVLSETPDTVTLTLWHRVTLFRTPFLSSFFQQVKGIRSPPTGFLNALNKVSEANFPERLHKCVMFPVGGVVLALVKTAMWFVAEETRAKFAFSNDLRKIEAAVGLAARDMGEGVANLILGNAFYSITDEDRAAAKTENDEDDDDL